jgi:CP12 domain
MTNKPDLIKMAIENARTICKEKGKTSLECIAAWDEVMNVIHAIMGEQETIAKEKHSSKLDQL